MSKIKVKEKKIALGGDNKELSDMFNQMIGTSNVDLTFAWPRFKRLRALSEKVISLIECFAKSPIMTLDYFSNNADEMLEFVEAGKLAIETIFGFSLRQYETNLASVPEDVHTEFTSAFNNVKDTSLMESFIILCDNLAPYRKNYSSRSSLTFIYSIVGFSWSPFPFTSLDMKALAAVDGIKENTIEFILYSLDELFINTLDIYKELRAPNIDIDKFVDIIMSSIDQIKKQPGLDRCHNAFKKIKESVSLLKSNFGNYYQDFVSAGDGSIIMEHFIIDVSKNTKSSPSLMREFRKIINFYKKAFQQKGSNAQADMLFSKIDKAFSTLSPENTSNIVNIQELDDDDNEDNSASANETETEESLRQAEEMEKRQAASLKSVEELAAEIEKM